MNMNEHERVIFDGLKAENRNLKIQLAQLAEAGDQTRMIGAMLSAVMSGLCANPNLATETHDVIAAKAVDLTNVVFAEMGKEK